MERGNVHFAGTRIDVDADWLGSLISAIMAAPWITFARMILLVALTIMSASSFLCAQSPSEAGSLIVNTLISESPQAVLLKKTDRILVGTVRNNGNYYEIEIADQSRVSIPRDQVDFVGANATEVYQHKCKNISRWLTGDHFKIARWCLQNNLLPQAVEHYVVVEKAAPDYPLVKQLGVEIEQKILSDEKFRAFAGLAPLAPAPAAATQVTAEVKPTTAKASASSEVTDHPQVALYFIDRVQPILVNRCSQSACHGVASTNSLRIIEPVGTAYSRISSQNLKNVLHFVAQDANGTPKLLSYATKPHGLQREPGITMTEIHLINELKNWIRFSENPIVPAVATMPAPLQSNPPSKLTAIAPGAAQLRAVPQAGPQVDFPSGTARPSMSEIDALEAQLNQVLPKAQAAAANSKDPFDPAEFNRQR